MKPQIGAGGHFRSSKIRQPKEKLWLANHLTIKHTVVLEGVDIGAYGLPSLHQLAEPAKV